MDRERFAPDGIKMRSGIMEDVNLFEFMGGWFSNDGGPTAGVIKRLGEGLKTIFAKRNLCSVRSVSLRVKD